MDDLLVKDGEKNRIYYKNKEMHQVEEWESFQDWYWKTVIIKWIFLQKTFVIIIELKVNIDKN